MLVLGNTKGIGMRAYALGLALIVMAAPADARMWKPTPQQIALDYTIINHNKGADGRVILQWLASSSISAPILQQLLDKYVLVSIVHTRQAPGGLTVYDDVEGMQVTDGSGQALKPVPDDSIPPSLVGLIASSDAALRQNTQGKGKSHWSVFEAGNVRACAPGKLQVTYEGETYSWDTPMPGCAKN